jgi:hypothetical protein
VENKSVPGIGCQRLKKIYRTFEKSRTHSCSPPNDWHILVINPMPGTFLFSTQCLAQIYRTFEIYL